MQRLFRQFSFPGRRAEPRRARDARLDPRRRRARLLAQPRVRRRVRQSRSRRRVRRRRRRGRDRAARDELALEQVPRPGRRRRGAPDPAPERLQDREPDRARAHPRAGAHRPARRLRVGAVSRRGRRSRASCTSSSRRRSITCSARSARSSSARASGGDTHAAALADDRAAHAEGLDRAEGGRRPARWRERGARTRCRSPTVREKPEHLAALEAWMRSYRPDELFDDAGRPRAEIVDWLPRGDRRMGANPHANGGLLLRDLALPDFRDYAVDVTSPGEPVAEATRVLGQYLRDVFRLNAGRARLPAVRPRRDRVEPARRGLRGDAEDVGGRDPAGRRRARARRPGHGDPVGDDVPGLARGLPAHGPARPVLVLRGVHAHRRLDVQPAREVAEDLARAAVAAVRSRRSTIS